MDSASFVFLKINCAMQKRLGKCFLKEKAATAPKGESSRFLFYAIEAMLKSLRSRCILGHNLNTLVIAARLANAIRTIEFTALRALHDVGGVFQLPNAGASLHLSGVGDFSLRYCHVVYLLKRACDNAFSLCEFYF